MGQRLVKVKVVELEGEKVFLEFSEWPGAAGACRFTVEIRFSPGDRAVFDGPTLPEVEALAERCLHASWASRRLMAGGRAARQP
jgi:hypothetical protein